MDLLENLAHNQSHNPRELVICSPREEFLDQILSGQRERQDNLRATQHPDGDEGEEAQNDGASVSGLDFLSPTLSALSTSRFIKLVFCPTVSSLRGYFSSRSPISISTTSYKTTDLIILNLVTQHHSSSEFTFQGLSQTLATIVSASTRMGQVVQLVECKDAKDPANAVSGSALWNAEVPLLSMSIKIGEDGARWGRRTVAVHKIASRWFSAEKSIDRNTTSRAATQRTEIPDSEDEMLI